MILKRIINLNYKNGFSNADKITHDTPRIKTKIAKSGPPLPYDTSKIQGIL